MTSSYSFKCSNQTADLDTWAWVLSIILSCSDLTPRELRKSKEKFKWWLVSGGWSITAGAGADRSVSILLDLWSDCFVFPADSAVLRSENYQEQFLCWEWGAATQLCHHTSKVGTFRVRERAELSFYFQSPPGLFTTEGSSLSSSHIQQSQGTLTLWRDFLPATPGAGPDSRGTRGTVRSQPWVVVMWCAALSSQ